MSYLIQTILECHFKLKVIFCVYTIPTCLENWCNNNIVIMCGYKMKAKRTRKSEWFEPISPCPKLRELIWTHLPLPQVKGIDFDTIHIHMTHWGLFSTVCYFKLCIKFSHSFKCSIKWVSNTYGRKVFFSIT